MNGSPTIADRLAARAPLLVLLASAGILGSALASQYLGGLAPCKLCHYQRWPYIATIVLSLGALVVFRGLGARRVLIGVCGVLFLAGAGVAVYHVGVEQGWFQGPTSCSGPAIEATTVEELRRQLLAAPIVRCDEVAWSMFGISMAGYNLIASVVLAAFALLSAAGRKMEEAR